MPHKPCVGRNFICSFYAQDVTRHHDGLQQSSLQTPEPNFLTADKKDILWLLALFLKQECSHQMPDNVNHCGFVNQCGSANSLWVCKILNRGNKKYLSFTSVNKIGMTINYIFSVSNVHDFAIYPAIY